MKFRHLINTILFLSVNTATGLPVMNLKKAVEQSSQRNCQRTSQVQNFRDMIWKASVMGEDDRKLLTENAEAMGFSEAEVEQAMRCTGRINCPGVAKGFASAGAVCPRGHRTSSGQCAADRLATVSHLFVDESTGRFKRGLDKCEFRNYFGFTSKLVISDLKSINPRIEAQNPYKNHRSDKMVLRLENPIPNCDPYDFNDRPIPLRSASEIFAVTHPHIDQFDRNPRVFDGNVPLGFNCPVTKEFSPQFGSAGMTWSACDINGFGSGGFLLVRNSEGRLVVAGIIRSSGKRAFDGQAYNEETGNITIAVSPNGDFQQIALNPGVPPNPSIVQSERVTISQPTTSN